MKKGQNTESTIKNILKFFKMNENSISTVMGGVVILIIAALIFNYFRTTNLKTWQGLLNQEDAASSTSAEKEIKDGDVIATYKVKKGDDLWHISENYYKSGYNYVDIIEKNNLPASGLITEGMELSIPKVEAKKITVAEDNKFGSIAPTEEKKEEGTKETVIVETSIESGEYTTKKGDTYWNIAVRSYGDGYAWVKIYEANKKIFGNPNVIHSDVKITIPSLK